MVRSSAERVAHLAARAASEPVLATGALRTFHSLVGPIPVRITAIEHDAFFGRLVVRFVVTADRGPVWPKGFEGSTSPLHITKREG